MKNGRERLKANSSNDYREVVTRKLAVQNHVAKAKNLCLTLWQDTREAVRARLNKEPTGAMEYNCSTKKWQIKEIPVPNQEIQAVQENPVVQIRIIQAQQKIRLAVVEVILLKNETKTPLPNGRFGASGAVARLKIPFISIKMF
ncbi:MAG: hypothetical protein FWC10_07475 [Lentimicrobiaceae bacterium]|nr:hypothetical protein [Lentimicrobiaceae bacterium]